MKKLLIAVLCMVLVLGMSACGNNAEVEDVESGSTEVVEKQGDTVEVTDVRGRTVEVPREIKTAYYPYYYENLLTICGEDIFNTITATSVYDTEHYSKTMWDLLMEKAPGFTDMEDVGSTINGDFDLEKLISLNPDVAILANYQYSVIGDEGISNLEQAGIPVVFIDYTLLTPEAHIDSTLILGKVFNKEDRAKELADQYKEKTDKIAEIVKNIPKDKRKTVYLEVRSSLKSYKDYGKAYGNDGMLSLMAGYAGAENIFADVQGSVDPDPEFLFESDPDFMFIDGGNFDDNSLGIKTGYTVDSETTKETLTDLVKGREGWENLSSVKNKNVYTIDNDIMRTLKDYVIIEYIGKQLYPEEFKDFDPEKETEEFIKKYVPLLPADSCFFQQLGE